jgi:hypothetical protein
MIALLTTLAAISLSGLLNVVLYLVVIGLIIWLLLWALGQVGLPDPFGRIIRVLIIVVGVILIINVLLGLVGHGFIDI